MAANPERRALLADAGLEVIADHGARGLTHRAVDREAGVPAGTCSNYFRSRAELLEALAERIFSRLQPDPDVVAELESRPRDVETLAAHMEEIVERTSRNPTLMRALLELRLEAARNPEVSNLVGRALRRGFAADLEYQLGSGLPGSTREVELLYHAINGLILDRITISIDGELDPGEAARELARRLSRPAT